MSWFKRHLNWTVVLAYVGPSLIVLAITLILVFKYPETAIEGFLTVSNLLLAAVFLLVGAWVLRQKNRSLWWLLILFILTTQ